jgi:DnaJ-domain-containing protein 1
MIYNPFKQLGIEPTKSFDEIKQAYEQTYSAMIIKGATEKEIFELKAARQSCEAYALEDGDVDLFTDFDRN